MDTPTFYFFKAGTLMAKIEGWPHEGKRDEMMAALRLLQLVH